jgi:polyhydroxyalkanoate synthesis regulator phasin
MGKYLVIISACLFFSMPLYAAKTEMTYEQYETQLAQLQQQEKTLKEQIAQQQSGIESLKQQLAELEQKIAALQKEKYAVLGITDADVTAAENELASIRQALELLSGLPPEDLLKRKNEVTAQQSRIEALKRKSVSYLWKVRDEIKPVEDLLEQVKAKLAQPLPQAQTASAASSYTVKLAPGNRESLSKIAAYDFVYGSVTKWPNLYRSNQSIIDKGFQRYSKRNPNPKYSRAEDLIYPGQVLDIPR